MCSDTAQKGIRLDRETDRQTAPYGTRLDEDAELPVPGHVVAVGVQAERPLAPLRVGVHGPERGLPAVCSAGVGVWCVLFGLCGVMCVRLAAAWPVCGVFCLVCVV